MGWWWIAMLTFNDPSSTEACDGVRRFNFARGGSLFAFGMRFSFRFGAERLGAASARNVIDEERCASTAWEQPIPQAAMGSGTGKADAAKASESAVPQLRLFPRSKFVSLRLGPGDLIEVGVYNGPELSKQGKNRDSGDVYLPLIDYVHVGDLTVEEARR